MVGYRWELPLASEERNNTGYIHGNAKPHLFNIVTGWSHCKRYWQVPLGAYVDEHGFYFHAYEPFNIHKINQEFKDTFASKSKAQKPSFTIRKKQK